MGFYGNITNTSNTTFNFDRIYSNRLVMDANVNNDGIFIGRYVLVEYQQDAAYPIVYIKDNKFYSSPNFEDISRIKFLSGKRVENSDTDNDGYFDGIYENEIVQTQQIGDDKTTVKFYKCVGQEGIYAKFNEVTPDDKSDYITNFGIDELHYSNEKGFKGYDSTVWVKSSITTNDGKLISKYVNIADLNSVIPTFDIAADAPTMTPITPHFDADSTNVYYKLHMQSPYGFRVKKGVLGQSDDDTTWYKTTYYKDEDKTETELVYSGPADIYYNQAGFDPEVPSKVSNKAEDNYIKLEPTGESGAIYAHGGQAKDIQEFSLHLPAIGNMMSDAWDIIHGPNRDNARTDENSSLQGRLDSFRFMADNQIPVKRAFDGTLIGTNINGNNQCEVPEQGILDQSLTTSFDTDDAWIRTEINTNGLLDELGNEIGNNGISIHHTFHSKEDTETSANKNNSNGDGINRGIGHDLKLYTPIVDKAGHVVGKNTETVILPYGFKIIATNGRGTSTTENASTTPSNSNIVAESTQDTLNINSGNKWIRMDTEVSSDTLTIAHDIHETSSTTSTKTLVSETAVTTFDVPTYSFDDAGHYLSHDTKTITVPYGYGKITGDSGSTSATATFDTLAIKADDAWIETTVSKDKINITHTGPVTGTPVIVANVEPEFGETFSITDWQYDSKGHKYDSTTHTVKMPDGSYTPANDATIHTDIITSLGFTPRTGAITSTKANTDTLTLYNYSANTNSHSKLIDIVDTDTINNAFKKIQNHINSLNLNVDEIINDTQIITSITQKNGQISLSRAAAGTLQLGTASTDDTIPATSSLNNAFNITNARIKKEEDALAKEIQDRKDAIDALTGTKDYSEHFDTMKEIADWLDANKDGVVDITLNVSANTTAIGNEKTRAEGIEAGLQEQINALGTASTKAIEDFATSAQGATADTTAATISTYGDIVTHNHLEYATAEQGTLAETALQLDTKIDYGEDKETLINIIADLQSRIQTLENIINNSQE